MVQKIKYNRSIIITGVLLGLVFGVYLYTLDYKSFHFETYHVLVVLLSLTIGFIVNVFVHELGHLVGGLASGYRFLSFRIFSWHIQRDSHGDIRLHHHKIPGTLGQCLMIPPQQHPVPVFLYNFGGVLFNGILVVILMVISFYTHNVTVSVVCFSIAAVGYFLAMTNWLIFPGLGNDGYNQKTIRENPKSKEVYLAVLELNARISLGERFLTLDLGGFEGLTYDDMIQVNGAMYLMSKAMFEQDFESYECLYQKILPMISGNAILQPIFELEYYFLKLLQNDVNAKDYKNKNVEKLLVTMRKKELVQLILLLEDLQFKGGYKESDYKEFKNTCLHSSQLGLALDLIDFADEILK